MTYTITEIYRVVCTDQYQSTTPEKPVTDGCEFFIKKEYFD